MHRLLKVDATIRDAVYVAAIALCLGTAAGFFIVQDWRSFVPFFILTVWITEHWAYERKLHMLRKQNGALAHAIATARRDELVRMIPHKPGPCWICKGSREESTEEDRRKCLCLLLSPN